MIFGYILFIICGLSTTDLAKMRQKLLAFKSVVGDSGENIHKGRIEE
jgi:hypothetical protein